MKTIVITGGSDGLGRAIATRLAPNHRVIIISSDEERLQQAATEIGCDYFVCDVRDFARIEQVFSEVGGIDCLINNAGVWLQGPLNEADPQRIHETLDINTLGTIYGTKAAIPIMKQQGSGLIINIVSQAGLNARAGWPVYAASKWAVTGFTKSMQEELAPFGVRVTGLYPGTFKTGLFDKAGNSKDLSDALDPDEVAKTVEFILGLAETTLFPEIGIKPFPKALQN